MAELAVADELTAEMRTELDTIEGGTADLERQLRAATVTADAEGDAETRTVAPDTEMRERFELRGKAQLTNYLMAAAKGRMVDGAEAELAAAAGIRGQGIPLELWDIPAPAEQRTAEDRAVAAVPGTVGVNLDPIRPFVFANSIASSLGIEMPRVDSGTYASATITTSQGAAPQAKSAAAVGVAGAITVSTAVPRRLSARLELTIEDIAAVGQANFESILRENLALALSDELDNQVINGDGSSNSLTGIFERLGDPAAPAATIETFDRFASKHAGGVDGLWARNIGEVAIIAGPETYVLSARIFQSATNYKGELSAAAYAMANTGGWTTNKRMPAKSGHIQQALLFRKGRSMMGGGGAMRTAVCPHWGMIDIDDIYSGSAKGERYFTMHVLLGDVILVQPDAYAQVAYRVST